MIRYFKTIQPAALFTIPIVALLLWLPGFFSTGANPVSFDSMLLNGMAKLPGPVQLIVSILLVAAGALYLNHVTTRHEVIYRHSFLPALFYVLLMSFHRDAIHFHPLLLSNIVIIRALDKTFSLFKNDSPVSSIFDSSFLVAVATLIYFPSFILFFLLLYSMYNLRSFSFREFMIAAIGFILPFFFLAVYGYCTDTLADFGVSLSQKFSLHKIHLENSITQVFIGFAAYFIVLLVLALVRLRSNFYRNTIKTRSTQEILFIFLVLSVAGLFILPRLSLYHFTQLAIPLAVFLAYYFISGKKRLWTYEAALWLLIGFIVLSYF